MQIQKTELLQLLTARGLTNTYQYYEYLSVSAAAVEEYQGLKV